MISRKSGYLHVSDDPAPPAVDQLQREGYVVLPGVFAADALQALAADIERVFREHEPDVRVDTLPAAHWEPFRYEMFNRSEESQRAIADRTILDVVEALIGEDCHVIANTAWWQPEVESDHGGRFWHIDSGPHVPRPPGIPWDERIPYPVFAIAAHIFLWDCPLESGPTGVIPGSHTSGQAPPLDRLTDNDLDWKGQRAVPVLADAGDVALFVSDVWHRRLPTAAGAPGRFFLQCHYGRRDLAQRIRPTSTANQASAEAIARATTKRDRTLIGLHAPFFYDG